MSRLSATIRALASFAFDHADEIAAHVEASLAAQDLTPTEPVPTTDAAPAPPASEAPAPPLMPAKGKDALLTFSLPNATEPYHYAAAVIAVDPDAMPPELILGTPVPGKRTVRQWTLRWRNARWFILEVSDAYDVSVEPK